MSRTCLISKERTFYKNLAILASRIVPSLFINNKNLSIMVDKLASNYCYEDYDYVGNLMGAYRSKEIIKKEFLGTPTRYQFENISVYGPERYDAYLTHIYGDWEKVPPVDRQSPVHDYFELDLNRPYMLG